MNTTYEMVISIKHPVTGKRSHDERLTFKSLWAAKQYAQNIRKMCVDVMGIDIIDNETGEIMYSDQDNYRFYEMAEA